MTSLPTHPARLDAEARRLDAAMLDWIAAAPAGFVQDGPDPARCWGLDAAAAAEVERRFEQLSLDLFAYQYERVPVYRAWADGLGRTPRSVSRAADVPALPVEAFKRARVAAFGPERERAAFDTSGTTGHEPGILHLDALELYDLALERGFRHHVLPDMERMRMLLLVPSLQEAPNSSLGYMLERVRRRWGGAGSACFVSGGALRWTELRTALQESCAAGEPVCILGTAFAWVHVLETCRRERFEIVLPPGSRGLETGGYKGRSRVLERAELHRDIERRLGVPRSRIVSEYGMTEMGSQFYTLALRWDVLGLPAGVETWSYPAWLRPRLLDSETARCMDMHEAHEPGLLAHHDLANRGSVAHLLTEDLGRPRGCSFELLGRAPRADLRGCGLAHEERSARAGGATA